MKRRAFTLIELLIVVAIIGILASIAIPVYRDATIKSRVAQVKMELRNLGIALDTYRLDNNHYPRKENDMLFFAQFLLPDLTSPIAYLNPVKINDPFGPVAEFEMPITPPTLEASGDFADRNYVPLQKNSYTYVPYINFASIHGIRNLMSESFAVASVGPDRMDSYIIDIPFPEFKRFPGESVYNPSNGVVSAGDIGYFSGNLRVSGLVGG